MENLIIKKLSKKDMAEIMTLQEIVYSEMPDQTHYICFDKKELKDSFKTKGLSLGVRHNDGSLVAYSLMLHKGTIYEKEIAESLGINEKELCYHESVVIREDYRGRGLQRRFMLMSEKHMKERGYKAIWCRVHPDNVYSRTNIEKQGFKLYKEVVAWMGYPRCLYVKDLRGV